MSPEDSRSAIAAFIPPRHLEDLLESCGEGILTCGADGTVVYANGAAERLTGWTREEMTGRTLGVGFPLFPGDLLEAWRNSEQNGRGSLTCDEITTTLLTRSAKAKACRVLLVPVRGAAGEAAAGFSCLFSGLDEPLALRLAAGDARDDYLALVERSSDIIFQLELNLLVRSVNSAVRTVLGYDPVELLGRQLELPLFLPPEEIRRLRGIGAGIIFREGISSKLFRIHRKNGDLFWGLLTLSPIRRGRSIRALLGIVRDVSEFYETREQLEYQHAQLKRTVSQLEEAYRLQEQFVANVTHELRTPLTTILITSEVLERSAPHDWPAAQRRQVELVHKNSLVLMDIINDLLDLAKLKRAGFELTLQDVRLREFLGAQVEEIEPLFAQKDLALQLEISPEIPEIFKTDPAILRKIITNLLSNAFKFTEQGGTIVRAYPAKDCLKISVADTGIGIAFEDLPRIFEEFRQIDGSDARRYPGTGLGLAIAERFAKMLGGRVHVESKPGSGSTFTLVLPIQAATAQPLYPY